jgi:hypothetical protein
MAEVIERALASMIGVDWRVHCEYQQYEDKKD